MNLKKLIHTSSYPGLCCTECNSRKAKEFTPTPKPPNSTLSQGEGGDQNLIQRPSKLNTSNLSPVPFPVKIIPFPVLKNNLKLLGINVKHLV